MRGLAVFLLAAGVLTPAGAASKAHAEAKLIGLDGASIGRASFQLCWPRKLRQ